MNIFERSGSYEKKIELQKRIIEDKKRTALEASEAGVSDEVMKLLLSDVTTAEGKLNEIMLESIRDRNELGTLIKEKVPNERMKYALYLRFIQNLPTRSVACEIGLSADYTKKLITKGKKMILAGGQNDE